MLQNPYITNEKQCLPTSTNNPPTWITLTPVIQKKNLNHLYDFLEKPQVAHTMNTAVQITTYGKFLGTSIESKKNSTCINS